MALKFSKIAWHFIQGEKRSFHPKILDDDHPRLM